ncbi:MAG: permease-like cell division protein FtsX [Candidatus Shapirobacteria bacterium]|nr:permease-like cell division protein FtsX [Candidatus Shapirobacteria bacterium]
MTNINTTWHHIRRSPFQSLVAVLIIFISLAIINLFLVVNRGMTQLIQYFETKPEVTIFLKDGLDRSVVENLQKELANYPSIREIKFISKEKALDIYREQNKNNPLLTEMVTASILPASFEVSVSDPKVLSQIAENFTIKTNEVDEIIYQKDIINTLLSWTQAIRQASLIIISVTLSISILVIFVIISMKITNRKEEIRVSRLLGASRFYVIKPFLLEGAYYGIIGGLLGFGTVTILSFAFKNSLNTFFTPITFISADYLFYATLLGGSCFFGVVIGLFASWIGVKRYIKF